MNRFNNNISKTSVLLEWKGQHYIENFKLLNH
nr:hypothetical protein [Orientia tsutsugamushi]